MGDVRRAEAELGGAGMFRSAGCGVNPPRQPLQLKTQLPRRQQTLPPPASGDHYADHGVLRVVRPLEQGWHGFSDTMRRTPWSGEPSIR
ncbi:hypothetical protein C4B68_37430 [Streptomyces dengpaensis]|uniref:Uncharacterized protein n=1 Tax=Streptomyces dengpaensis TaxID=2049881 RepID=A0ABM6T0J0_9ACTN|nr:hypothetical protein C4B68_37430 [Streptomyces dengpaensis]PIB07554.1 hypothetical protein B1C81_18625 [Streptomyces sp. HG99]